MVFCSRRIGLPGGSETQSTVATKRRMDLSSHTIEDDSDHDSPGGGSRCRETTVSDAHGLTLSDRGCEREIEDFRIREVRSETGLKRLSDRRARIPSLG